MPRPERPGELRCSQGRGAAGNSVERSPGARLVQGVWRPLRIAQVAPLYERVPPERYGGTERVVSYLTAELVRLGHDVTLFASGDSLTAAHLDSYVRRHRGPHAGDADHRAAVRERHLDRMGTADTLPARPTVQSDELPQRVDLAARQRAGCRGILPIRRHGPGRAGPDGALRRQQDRGVGSAPGAEGAPSCRPGSSVSRSAGSAWPMHGSICP